MRVGCPFSNVGFCLGNWSGVKCFFQFFPRNKPHTGAFLSGRCLIFAPGKTSLLTQHLQKKLGTILWFAELIVHSGVFVLLSQCFFYMFIKAAKVFSQVVTSREQNGYGTRGVCFQLLILSIVHPEVGAPGRPPELLARRFPKAPSAFFLVLGT